MAHFQRWLILGVGGLIPALLGGCVLTGEKGGSKHEPPAVPVHQLVVNWKDQVGFVPDSNANGKPIPGFAGRIYFFGSDMAYPLPVDGPVTVELLDPNVRDAKGDPQRLDHWTLQAETMTSLGKKDVFGLGYTIFLPWEGYRPDVTEVLLRTSYRQKGGVPMFHNSGRIRLGAIEVIQPPTISSRQEIGEERIKAPAPGQPTVPVEELSVIPKPFRKVPPRTEMNRSRIPIYQNRR